MWLHEEVWNVCTLLWSLVYEWYLLSNPSVAQHVWCSLLQTYLSHRKSYFFCRSDQNPCNPVWGGLCAVFYFVVQHLWNDQLSMTYFMFLHGYTSRLSSQLGRIVICWDPLHMIWWLITGSNNCTSHKVKGESDIWHSPSWILRLFSEKMLSSDLNSLILSVTEGCVAHKHWL